ncbi:unnamed protein product, partial [Chrysoparadoxa australica]
MTNEWMLMTGLNIRTYGVPSRSQGYHLTCKVKCTSSLVLLTDLTGQHRLVYEVPVIVLQARRQWSWLMTRDHCFRWRIRNVHYLILQVRRALEEALPLLLQLLLPLLIRGCHSATL